MAEKVKTVLLVGATGSLGRVLGPIIGADWSMVAVSRTSAHTSGVEADMADPDLARRVLDAHAPDIIVNLAALTDVDDCESDESFARHLNVTLCKNLADWALKRSAATRIVHISTDQVYSGPGPHMEEHPQPINVYARTKLAGECEVLRAPSSVVLRTNFFNAGPGVTRGLAAWLLNSLADGTKIRLFEDILFNPLYAPDLARIVTRFMQNDATGVFNVGATDGLSKAEFARLLADRFGLSLANAVPAISTDENLSAPRPKDMRMDTARLTKLIGKTMPTVGDGVDALRRDTVALNWQPLALANVR
ncbi:MAG: sugar nucleotide-binding protein [Alphaproteobacteria bacterium]|nr:sugar nucleotide-binding protein [Alphaproteobacteria bacterium]